MKILDRLLNTALLIVIVPYIIFGGLFAYIKVNNFLDKRSFLTECVSEGRSEAVCNILAEEYMNID